MDDETARTLGFEDAAQFARLVASVDLSTPDAIAKFQRWKGEDGSKSGLVAAFPEVES